MCDLITWPWPHFLLKLPFVLRLALCIGSFPVCLTLYFLAPPAAHMIAILTIPMGLCSWLFLSRGACICFFLSTALQFVYHLYYFDFRWWPLAYLITFVSSTCILFIEGSVFVSLRKLFDTQQTARLKAELSEREITRAYEQQCQLNMLKNQFILNVNHELRTPLTGVMGYIEMLQVLLTDQGALQYSEHAIFFERAMQHCHELHAIVNSVLGAMKLADSKRALTLEFISLRRIVVDVLTEYQGFHPHLHRVLLDIPEHLQVLTNVQCTRHVIHNLFSNAFKYTPENSPISIKAFRSLPEGQRRSEVCLCIEDKGPGIPPDELPLLFGQFVRLQRDLSGTIRGSGLGLYISKHLMEAVGGRIWVESEGIEGRGSRFYIALPSSQPSSPQAA